MTGFGFTTLDVNRLSSLVSLVASRRRFSVLSIFVGTNDIICSRFGRKKPLVYCMVIAAIASAGAVLFTMYDPGEDKGRLVTIRL